MKTRCPSVLALCALVGALAPCAHADATDQAAITNAAGPASAASGALARRTLKFNTHHAVPGTLTLSKEAAIGDGWKPLLRFAGQTATARCEFHLPKVGQRVRPGETAVVTIACTTPWQVYDNGLSYEAFEDGHKVGAGTLRP